MKNLIDMLDALRSDRPGDAQSSFEAAMTEKVNAALDQQKIAVAGQIYNKAIQASK